MEKRYTQWWRRYSSCSVLTQCVFLELLVEAWYEDDRVLQEPESETQMSSWQQQPLNQTFRAQRRCQLSIWAWRLVQLMPHWLRTAFLLAKGMFVLVHGMLPRRGTCLHTDHDDESLSMQYCNETLNQHFVWESINFPGREKKWANSIRTLDTRFVRGTRLSKCHQLVSIWLQTSSE